MEKEDLCLGRYQTLPPQGSKRVNVTSREHKRRPQGISDPCLRKDLLSFPGMFPIHHPLMQVARKRYAASPRCAKVWILNTFTDHSFLPKIMPSIPATEAPRLKDKDILCLFIRSPGGGRQRSGFGNSTCVQGLILCSLGYASGKTCFCLPTTSELIE